MENNPQVSVLVPCYNGEKYLRQCLNSIVRQEGVSFEVIVVDDGSDNGSNIEQICLEAADDRVIYLHKDNGGVSSALNLGLEYAKGDVFCWLSHDDMFAKNRLVNQWNVWSSLNDRALLYGDFAQVDSKGVLKGRTRIGSYPNAIDVISRGLVQGGTIMTSRELVLEVGGFKEELQTTQDFDLWLRLDKQNVKFIYTPYLLCYSRQHNDQGSKLNPYRQVENVNLWTEIAVRLSETYAEKGTRSHDRKLILLNEFLESSIFHRSLEMSPVSVKIRSLLHE